MKIYTKPTKDLQGNIVGMALPVWAESPPTQEWIEVSVPPRPQSINPMIFSLVEDSWPPQGMWIEGEMVSPPPLPRIGDFYHTIQRSLEFQSLDGWAVLNGSKPAAILLSRAMSVVLEAKAYADQFGGNATNLDAVQARLSQFVAALDDTTDYGGTTKAEIIVRIEAAIELSHLPITPAFVEV